MPQGPFTPVQRPTISGWSRVAPTQLTPTSTAPLPNRREPDRQEFSDHGSIGPRSSHTESERIDSEFLELYRSEWASTVRLARMLTGNPDVAEDLAQESFLRLYRNRARAERPGGLLRTITVNVCRSWQTSHRRAHLRMVRHGPDADTLDPFARDLDDALRKLKWKHRSVIVLRYWLGLNEAEIASTLGCRPGTVKSRTSRALEVLRHELAEPPDLAPSPRSQPTTTITNRTTHPTSTKKQEPPQ